MKIWLLNPFKFIAGNKALWLGVSAMFITALLGFLTNEHLDGVIDVHIGEAAPFYYYFIESFIDWLCLLLPLYLFGKNFSMSTIRFIDVAGTSALARYPIFFVVLLTTLSPTAIINTQNIQPTPALIIKICGLALLIIPFIIWTVALMYNAYSVSANLKGPKAVWSFITSLLIAEIFSKIIISFIL